MLNTDKLIKVLNLSISDFDGEALNCIRQANKMLKDERTGWSSIIGAPRVDSVAHFKETIRNLQNEIEGLEAEVGRLRYRINLLQLENSQIKNTQPYSRPHSQPSQEASEEIPSNVMLEFCMANIHGSIRDFIMSLDRYFKERGYLTDKQRAALKKIYERSIRR